jgi:hypothetical protein
MAPENEKVGHIGLSLFHNEKLWVRWIDLDGKKIPVPEIGGEYFRFDELPPLREGQRGGVGIVLAGLADGRSLGGIDLDGCLVDGVLLPWAQEIVDEVGSYTEVSPSGTGVKSFFTLEEKAKATRLYRKHVQWPKHSSQAKGWGIECYITGGRFFTVTAKVYRNCRVVEAVSASKLKWVSERMKAFDGAAKAQKAVLKAISFMKNDDLPWEDWNTRGMAIYNATLGSLAGRDAWFEFSRKSPKFTEKETAGRWQHWPTSPGQFVDARNVFDWAREGGYEPDDDIADQLECRRQVEELNDKWATITLGKDFYILSSAPKPRQLYSIIRTDAWRKARAGFSPKFGEDQVPLHEIWLESRYRRQYEGVVLEPSGGPDDHYNLWRGWAVQPKAGSWELFKRHLFHVICKGEATNWRYLRKWIACRLQKLDKKIGVAIVLKGGKGAGKTIVADYLQKIFGVHFVRVSHERHFLGNFNVHFEHALLVNAEEAFWAGKKSAEGVLKDMITGDSIMIERKGVDSYQARNLLDVLITSNADWVVPVSHDERRYFVLEVSNEKVGDFDYFRELAAEMDGHGPAAMLAELLAEDLSGFEPRQVPSTDALWEQKIEGMKSEESFLYDIARNAKVLGMSLDHTVSREWFYRDYLMFCSDQKIRHPVKVGVFGKLVVKLGVGKGKLSGVGSRVGVYRFPSLAEFRAAFAEHMGHSIEWQEDAGDGSEPAQEWQGIVKPTANAKPGERRNLDFDKPQPR